MVYTSAAIPETGNFTESTSTTLQLTQVGTYTWHASYDDEGNLTADTGVNETVTVGKASPTLSTQASAGGPEASTAVLDTATLSGGFNESGDITFKLEDASNNVVFTSIKAANGNSPVTSDSFTPPRTASITGWSATRATATTSPIRRLQQQRRAGDHHRGDADADDRGFAHRPPWETRLRSATRPR